MMKADIRLDKIAQRNNKPHYKHLNVEQKRLVKAMEKVKNSEMTMWKEEVVYNNKDWRKEEWAGEFLDTYLWRCDRLSKIKAKLDYDEDKYNAIFESTRTARFYGGSF